MVCLPTITAPTGSWARRRETSRADVRPTHRATVRSDERARPPRRAPGRSSTNPPQAPGRRVRAKPGHTRIHACTKFFRFKNPATPAKGTTCFRSFSLGNDLFTTLFTAQMGRGKIQWGAFTSRRWFKSVDVLEHPRIPLIRRIVKEGGMFIQGKTSERDGRCARTCDTDVLSHVSKTQNAFDSEALDGP